MNTAKIISIQQGLKVLDSHISTIGSPERRGFCEAINAASIHRDLLTRSKEGQEVIQHWRLPT